MWKVFQLQRNVCFQCLNIILNFSTLCLVRTVITSSLTLMWLDEGIQKLFCTTKGKLSISIRMFISFHFELHKRLWVLWCDGVTWMTFWFNSKLLLLSFPAIVLRSTLNFTITVPVNNFGLRVGNFPSTKYYLEPVKSTFKRANCQNTSFQRLKWLQTKMHTTSDTIFGHNF